MINVLNSANLRLTAVTIQDIDVLYDNAYNNQSFMQLFKLNHNHNKQQIVERYLEREKTEFSRRSYKEYLIRHEHYGVIGLAALADHNTFHNSAEILIGLFNEKYRKSIYGLKATLLLMDKAFNQYGLNRLNSYVYGHNQYACQCTEKLGFALEGLRKDYIYCEAEQCYIDVYCFGMRAVDFRNNNALGRYSQRLIGKDITSPTTEKKGVKSKTGIILASAVCSKLALAPAYGKTSDSSSGSSSSSSDGKNSSSSSSSSGGSSSSSDGKTSSNENTISTCTPLIPSSCSSTASSGGVIDVSNGTDTSSVVSPSEGKTAAGAGSGNFDNIDCSENVPENPAEFDPLDSLIFLDSFYVKANPDLTEILGSNFSYKDARQHWGDYGLSEGRIASPSFDVVYYLKRNPDLKQVFGSDYVAAAEHWVQTGIYEGRVGAEAFNAQYYLSTNSDIYKYFGADFPKATSHWLNAGIVEGRKFSENLDVKYYLKKNPDLQNAFGENYAAAVTHWLLKGKNEDRVFIKDDSYQVNKVDCNQLGAVTNTYHAGDYINYKASIEIDSSTVNKVYQVNGTASIKYSSTNTSNTDAVQTLKLTSNITYWGETHSEHSYVFYDGAGNLKTYKTSNDQCVNYNNCEEGFILWPAEIAVGDSWAYQYTVDELGNLIEVNANYNVTGMESLDAPLGTIEANVIEYSSIKRDACTHFDCSANFGNSHTKTGTIWYVSGLGEVKRVEEYVKINSKETRKINSTLIISSTNMSY